jgi:hypothetical protein
LVEYSGGDGSSMEKAVQIIGVQNSMQGIQAEYQYLSEKFGVRGTDWQLKMQFLMEDKGKSYDMMKISLKDGRELDVFFDISEFFGK